MKQGKFSVWIVMLLGVVFVTSGCDERIRKKFVREKNADKLDQIDVVFQPVEYSTENYDPAEQYERNYLLWKAWHSDLRYAFERNESQKRKKYLLDNAKDALYSMQYWLNDEAKADFEQALVPLKKVEDELKKIEALQSRDVILRQLDTVQSKILGEYDLKNVESRLIRHL